MSVGGSIIRAARRGSGQVTSDTSSAIASPKCTMTRPRTKPRRCVRSLRCGTPRRFSRRAATPVAASVSGFQHPARELLYELGAHSRRHSSRVFGRIAIAHVGSYDGALKPLDQREHFPDGQSPRLPMRDARREGRIQAVDVHRHVQRAVELGATSSGPCPHVDRLDTVSLSVGPLLLVHRSYADLDEAFDETILHDPREWTRV